MGSTGSGNFSDYSGKRNDSNGETSSGGRSGDDQCRAAFHADLEDVADYDFYTKTKSVPEKGASLTLVLNKRILAVDGAGRTVGALPTSLNYLAACIESGFKYTGVVAESATRPVPRVSADFAAE